MVKTVTLEPTVLQQFLDQLRLLFHARITRSFCVQAHKDSNPALRTVVEQMDKSIEAYEKAILETLPQSNAKWLENELSKDKLFDIASLVELVARIGVQEKDDVYEEFLSLVVDLVDTVFYCQKNRKNLHFGKYKALFKLIADECRRDTNKEESQIWYRNGVLWLRSMVPEPVTPQL